MTLLVALALATTLDVTAGAMHRYSLAAAALHDPHRTVRVYLPPSYARPESAARRYPVVFLLHGWPGSDGNWVRMGHAATTADSLIARGRMPEAILVFPDGRGRGLLGRSLYLDAADGSSPVETWIVRDLVAWVDSTFRTVPDARHRGVIGLSDGGTAAFNLALRHPGVFGAAGSHSGEFAFGHPFGSGALLGHGAQAESLLRAHSPLLYVGRLAGTARRATLYFDCGLGDGNLADNRRFDARLDSLGIPHVYREYPGHHSWGYWRRHLVTSLEIVTSRMRDPQAGP